MKTSASLSSLECFQDEEVLWRGTDEWDVVSLKEKIDKNMNKYIININNT